jgi:glycosyltransferase involved in cell wall biosynthesis
LLATQSQARLIYVGAGPCRDALLERAAALGCPDRISLAGAVPHAALGDWFRAADLLCLPSHNEGVPNVILEAMACGVPVVATRVGGIPEVVPEYAGLLVPPRESASLSTALVDAAAREWDSSRIAAHASGFRWDDNVARLSGILQTAVHPPRVGSAA